MKLDEVRFTFALHKYDQFGFFHGAIDDECYTISLYLGCITFEVFINSNPPKNSADQSNSEDQSKD